MDNTKESPTVLSFCTGYGGLEGGIERAIGKCSILAHVEIEAFAVTNLVNKMETGAMDPVPIWTDIKTFDPRPFRGTVDILTGGYPCSPFSFAGLRKGEKDPRHLWPYFRDAIGVIRPKVVFFENVEGHISKGLREVLADLDSLGYRVEGPGGEPTWGVFSAAEVGATHGRKRVFILGYAKGDDEWRLPIVAMHRQRLEAGGSGGYQVVADSDFEGLQKCRQSGEICRTSVEACPAVARSRGQWPARPGQLQHEWEAPRTIPGKRLGNPDSGRCEEGSGVSRAEESSRSAHRPHTERSGESMANAELSGSEQHRSDSGVGREREQVQDEQVAAYGQVEPRVGRAVDGVRDRIDRLRLLGNGVVPQTAEKAFITLYRRMFNG